MQTFLPYADFAASARTLDTKRLKNQRNECWVILSAVRGAAKAWQHHPAVKQWVGYAAALRAYALAVCDECDGRSIADTKAKRAQFEALALGPVVLPPWLGVPEYHRSHQSNLIRKAPEHYGPLFLGVPATLPYVWPSKRATFSSTER